MSDQPRGDDPGHRLVGIADPGPSLVSEREGDGLGDLVVSGFSHGLSLPVGREHIKNTTAAWTTFKTPADLGAMDVRVVQIDGNPWFVAADVCRALGLPFGYGQGSTSRYLQGIAADERRTVTRASGSEFSPLFAGSKASQINLISESGLYRLILRAHTSNPDASRFQTWVTRDVLPTIRKTGSYVMGEEKLDDPNLTLSDLACRPSRPPTTWGPGTCA
ncbi:MAG: hypothetical protein J0H67_05005 [Rhodospirillales bacterium]|nr:hypothetical protein [Rhodospirillales bacterium]